MLAISLKTWIRPWSLWFNKASEVRGQKSTPIITWGLGSKTGKTGCLQKSTFSMGKVKNQINTNTRGSRWEKLPVSVLAGERAWLEELPRRIPDHKPRPRGPGPQFALALPVRPQSPGPPVGLQPSWPALPPDFWQDQNAIPCGEKQSLLRLLKVPKIKFSQMGTEDQGSRIWGIKCVGARDSDPGSRQIEEKGK